MSKSNQSSDLEFVVLKDSDEEEEIAELNDAPKKRWPVYWICGGLFIIVLASLVFYAVKIYQSNKIPVVYRSSIQKPEKPFESSVMPAENSVASSESPEKPAESPVTPAESLVTSFESPLTPAVETSPPEPVTPRIYRYAIKDIPQPESVKTEPVKPEKKSIAPKYEAMEKKTIFTRPFTKKQPVAYLNFLSFVILLSENSTWTYLSTNLVLKPSNHNVYKEIQKKKVFFRGAIYGILTRLFQTRDPQLFPKKELKQHIINDLNYLLVTGRVEVIYFMDFLVN
ncbi:hypothetical protein GMMP15_1580010 [Candidatus Magnetomoraceae bacterium gMMP-15]